jgi:hypothetical protein
MHIKSEFNCSDVLTKHWGYNTVWQHILKPLFHYAGNTAGNLMFDDTLLVDVSNLMYDDTLLVDISIDDTVLSSTINDNGECEILYKVMEEGFNKTHDRSHSTVRIEWM